MPIDMQQIIKDAFRRNQKQANPLNTSRSYDLLYPGEKRHFFYKLLAREHSTIAITTEQVTERQLTQVPNLPSPTVKISSPTVKIFELQHSLLKEFQQFICEKKDITSVQQFNNAVTTFLAKPLPLVSESLEESPSKSYGDILKTSRFDISFGTSKAWELFNGMCHELRQVVYSASEYNARKVAKFKRDVQTNIEKYEALIIREFTTPHGANFKQVTALINSYVNYLRQEQQFACQTYPQTNQNLNDSFGLLKKACEDLKLIKTKSPNAPKNVTEYLTTLEKECDTIIKNIDNQLKRLSPQTSGTVDKDLFRRPKHR